MFNLKRKIRGLMIRMKNHGPRVFIAKHTVVRRILQFAPVMTPSKATLEMHMLVSHREFMGMLWSLWSFYMQCETPVSLVVHDDGSVTSVDRAVLERLFPGSRFIEYAKSTEEMNEKLRSFPLCRALRQRHPLAVKIFDFFEYCSAPGVLMADSDIIFYRSPKKILEWPTDGATPNVFIEDVWTNYLLPPARLKELFGCTVPERINIGFGRVSRSALDLAMVEEVLRMPEVRDAPFLFSQTIVSLLAAKQGVAVIGGPYRMTLSNGIGEHVLKHYTRVIRHLLYTEGISEVSRRSRSPRMSPAVEGID